MLISEIQELTRLNFMAFNVNFVPRSCNRAGHALVAQGCELSEDDITLMNIFLSCILSLVADYHTPHQC
jgi:hypothetical protein